MKRVILNVAVPGGGHGDSWYQRGQSRLAESLDKIGEEADRMFFTTWPGTPHSEVPYGFKPQAFMLAREQGYHQALWFDSSCSVVRPLDDAWGVLDKQGYLLGMEGWLVGQWCAPEVRDLLGRTQDELDDMILVEGKMIGIDFTSDVGNLFLDRWDRYAKSGAFNGSHENHRHDITCAGIIAADMDLTLTPHLIEINSGGTPHPEVYVQVSAM